MAASEVQSRTEVTEDWGAWLEGPARMSNWAAKGMPTVVPGPKKSSRLPAGMLRCGAMQVCDAGEAEHVGAPSTEIIALPLPRREARGTAVSGLVLKQRKQMPSGAGCRRSGAEVPDGLARRLGVI